MKKIKFYVCSNCNNIITATDEVSIACCGEKLKSLEGKKAEENEKLSVEKIENDYFISSEHEMTKENYIAFVALVTGDTILMKKQYPEWSLQTRIPIIGRGILYWYSTTEGLFYQLV